LCRIASDTDSNAHDGAIQCAIFIYNGAVLVTGGRDTSIRFWAVDKNFSFIESLLGHKVRWVFHSFFGSISFQFILDSPLTMLNVPTPSSQGHVLTLEFCAATNMLASGAREQQVKLWDVASLHASTRQQREDNKAIRVHLHMNIDAHRGDVTCLRFSAQGDILLSGARDNEIRVWDVASGKLIRTSTGHKGDIHQLLLLNQERLMLSASQDSTVRLWEFVRTHLPLFLCEFRFSACLHHYLVTQDAHPGVVYRTAQLPM